MRIDRPMFGLLAVFNVVDAASTDFLIEKGRYGEMNPVMQWLMEAIGQDAALYGTKGLLCLALGFIVFRYPSPAVTIGLIVCVIAYGACVAHHAILRGIL
jgi:hypothetical protein